MPRPYNRTGMANRVLDAALELGLRHPKSEVAIETIAQQAGMSFWQAYRCFANQRTLYRAAISRLVTQIEEDLREEPEKAESVSEAIRRYIEFAVGLVQRDVYVQFIQIAIRDRGIEPSIEAIYDRRILAKFREGLSRAVQAAGARHGLFILLPEDTADAILKALEMELVLPRLLPRFVAPPAGAVERLVSRLSTQTMAVSFAVEAQAA